MLREAYVEYRHQGLRGTRHVSVFTIKDDNDSPICRCGNLVAMCKTRGNCPALRVGLPPQYDAAIAAWRRGR